MLFIAGYDIYNQSWLPAREQFEDLDLGEEGTFDEIYDDLTEEIGVDIESELLAQLTGEYAIAADVSEFEDEPDFSILALLDLEDPATAQTAIEELMDYAEDQEGSSLEDQGITWTIDDGDFLGGYPESVVDEAAAGFDDSLADNGDWQRTLELLPGRQDVHRLREHRASSWTRSERCRTRRRMCSRRRTARSVSRTSSRSGPLGSRGRRAITGSGSTLCCLWRTDARRNPPSPEQGQPESEPATRAYGLGADSRCEAMSVRDTSGQTRAPPTGRMPFAPTWCQCLRS